MNPINLEQRIEAADERHWKVVMNELEKLTDSQLSKIAAIIGIKFTSQATARRDELINILDESTWREFFTAYHKVMGKRFVLDPTEV
jgi:hypothetical protein